jgi:hypothetical protein
MEAPGRPSQSLESDAGGSRMREMNVYEQRYTTMDSTPFIAPAPLRRELRRFDVVHEEQAEDCTPELPARRRRAKHERVNA